MKLKPSSTDAGARLQQLLKERVKRPLLKPAVEPQQMPLWPSGKRAVPNELARSALFTSSRQREPRAQIDGSAPIVSQAGFELRYSGQELRQDDLDLWLQVVDMSQGTDLVHHVEFTGATMLTLLGWGLGEASYQRLRDAKLEPAQQKTQRLPIATSNKPQVAMESAAGQENGRPLPLTHSGRTTAIAFLRLVQTAQRGKVF